MNIGVCTFLCLRKYCTEELFNHTLMYRDKLSRKKRYPRKILDFDLKVFAHYELGLVTFYWIWTGNL